MATGSFAGMCLQSAGWRALGVLIDQLRAPGLGFFCSRELNTMLWVALLPTCAKLYRGGHTRVQGHLLQKSLSRITADPCEKDQHPETKLQRLGFKSCIATTKHVLANPTSLAARSFRSAAWLARGPSTSARGLTSGPEGLSIKLAKRVHKLFIV